MPNNTETLLRRENQQEVTEVMEFLCKLSQDEKKDFLTFLTGFQICKKYYTNRIGGGSGSEGRRNI